MSTDLTKYTYTYLMQVALESVQNDVDKAQGSIIYDALSGACFNLAILYADMVQAINDVFPDTAEGEWLDKNVANFGLEREKATSSQVYIVTKDEDGEEFDIPIGSRFNIKTVNFVVESKLVTGKFIAKCETTGTIGNIEFGNVIPIENIDGLGEAYIDGIAIYGEDDETDDVLRERFYSHVKEKPFAGNVPAYKKETMAVDGVGAVEVFPIWDGPGTVKVVIGDINQKAATTELIDKVQTVFGTLDTGEGLAPVGHVVTVDTCAEKAVNISATVTASDGYSSEIISEKIQTALESYFNSVSFSQQTVFVSKVSAIMIDIEGVEDVQNVKINEVEENLILSKDKTLFEVPVLGEVVLS